MRALLVPGLAVLALVVATREARAGCSDGACGRVDWTEVTATAGAQATAAKLHGRYAWEASNQWSDGHPVGGKIQGFLWLSCGADDTVCRARLQAELGKVGTTNPLYFGGAFYDLQMGKPVQPAVLFAEGAAGAPTPLEAANLGIQPMNSEVCPTAFALAPLPAPDAGAPPPADAAAADASDNNPQGVPDNSACAVGHGGSAGAWLLLLLLVPLLRRRR